MKTFKIRWWQLSFLALIALPLPAQQNGKVLPMETYMQVENALARDVQNHKEELENNLESKRLEYRQEVNDQIAEVREASAQIQLMIWVLGGLTFAGLVGLLWGVVNYVRGNVQKFVHTQIDLEYPKLVKKQMEKIFDEDNEKLAELIQEKSFEQTMKSKMAFLVLSGDDKDEREAEKLIKKTLGFQKAQFKLISDYDQNDNQEFDLVVIYDLNNKLVEKRENELQKILADAKQSGGKTTYLLALQQFWQDLNHYRNIANAANSPFTLYGQMLDTLSYIYLKDKA